MADQRVKVRWTITRDGEVDVTGSGRFPPDYDWNDVRDHIWQRLGARKETTALHDIHVRPRFRAHFFDRFFADVFGAPRARFCWP